MSVQLPEFTENVNIISTLADQPTMTATELKAKFDEASGKIKYYINNVLLAGIDSWGDDLKETIEGELESAIAELQALIDGLTAGNVTYDNTTSGLTADDVQEAIDEINTALATVTSNVNTNLGKKTVYNDFVVTTVSDSVSRPATGSLQIVDYTGTVTATKSGYMPIGIVGFHYTKPTVNCEFLRAELTSRTSGRGVITYKIRLNNTQTSTSHTLYFNILWVKVR